jgi:uncharacterized protein
MIVTNSLGYFSLKTEHYIQNLYRRKCIMTIRKLALAAVLLIVVLATTSFAQQYPKATGYVNDFADLLTHEQGDSLNEELIAFEKKTSIEIAVVTVPWLNNQSIEDYTRDLAREWAVGKSGQNNGVVFLIAPKERKMRIETASGVRAVLTDGLANRIRDNAVLPRFKAGNMAQGIIDGTHEIMGVLDASSDPVAVSQPKEQTLDDMKSLWYLSAGILGLGVLALLVLFSVQRWQARKYVLENKVVLATRFGEAERIAMSLDVKDAARNLLRNLRARFILIDELSPSSKGVNWIKSRESLDVKDAARNLLRNLRARFILIDELSPSSKGVNWIKSRESLDSIDRSLGKAILNMRQEIAFAEKARTEGPKLFQSIPEMLKAAEEKLAEGKSSPDGVRCLERARTQWAQVQSQHQDTSVTDWLVLYLILTSISSDTAKAESHHENVNTDYPNGYSSGLSPSKTTESYGFGDSGDSGGFGGGSGFDGGGSSGDW